MPSPWAVLLLDLKWPAAPPDDGDGARPPSLGRTQGDGDPFVRARVHHTSLPVPASITQSTSPPPPAGGAMTAAAAKGDGKCAAAAASPPAG
ncbi:hypothetical protein DAI22_01g196401 [Oryza sativa Japonica Group]|nr:hypothetical protein DAI22_01g196401 [Oryza sativa Japonica Group]